MYNPRPTMNAHPNNGERIRTGFSRWPFVRPPLHDQEQGVGDAGYHHHYQQHPFLDCFFVDDEDADDNDDPFTPIVISNDSGSTVCSGITMDTALVEGAKCQSELAAAKASLLLLGQSTTNTYSLCHRTGSGDDLQSTASAPHPIVRHSNLATPDAREMTTTQHTTTQQTGPTIAIHNNTNIFNDLNNHHHPVNSNYYSLNRINSLLDQDDTTYDDDDNDDEVEDLDAVLAELGWTEDADAGAHDDIAVKKAPGITSFRTESTVESLEDDDVYYEGANVGVSEQTAIQVDTCNIMHVRRLDDLPTQESTSSQERERPSGVEATSTTSTTAASKRNVSIQLEDFDMDHLTMYEDSILDNLSSDDDELSFDDGELGILRKLEANSPDLYWLQLTTALTDSKRLAQALKGNTGVRNVTVYPSAIEKLSGAEQEAVVDAICQLRNLKNLIVFQDCGSLFVDPLIRYRPPLNRLTLYKLDVSGDNLFSKLVMLLVGLRGLEELSLEKYKGDSGSRLLRAVAKVLPNMKNLTSLTLTPSRGVRLTSDGPLALFRALWQNKTIRSLSLQGSADSVDQAAITELGNALRANSTLEDIKLTGFWKNEDAFWKRFTPKSTKRISYYLGLNKAGIRTLQLDVNTNFEALRNVIVSQKDNLDHVYYLMLQNPSVVNAVVC